LIVNRQPIPQNPQTLDVRFPIYPRYFGLDKLSIINTLDAGICHPEEILWRKL
jgi:hypothetical protein